MTEINDIDLLTECIHLSSISQDLEIGATDTAEVAFEKGYRCALNHIMEEVAPGVNWAERVKEYRRTGWFNVEH